MRLLIGLMAMAFVVATADAQPVGAPTLTVGDSWKRSNGLEIKVVSADDAGYVFTGFIADCPTCRTHADKNLLLSNVTDADGKPIDPTRLRGVFVGPGWKVL